MLLADLPNDAIALILVRLEYTRRIARTAPTCRALRDAARPAQQALRRICREQFVALVHSLEAEPGDHFRLRGELDAATHAAVMIVINERTQDQHAAAEDAVSIVDDAFRAAPPERHLALMKFIDALLKVNRYNQSRVKFVFPLLERLPRIIDIAHAAATEQTAPKLKVVAEAWWRFATAWTPDVCDALGRFLRSRERCGA